MPKIRMRKMPVTNSGVAVNVRPTTEMARSMALPSFTPATMPNSRASGMTTAKATPANTNELRNRVKSVTDTGRPVCSDMPASPRNSPLRSGMYCCGPSPSRRRPESVRTHTSAPCPRTHLTALLFWSTPQKYSLPSSAISHATPVGATTIPPSGWR